jgi:glutamine amidotransferase
MKNSNIIVVDYQLGNLFSVKQALKHIGLTCKISSNPNDIGDADALVLPGVGAFKDAMENLNKLGLADEIIKFIKSGKPFFGICLGLQLLFSKSEEFGDSKGLDLIKGSVSKFPNIKKNGEISKVPQISWNSIIKSNRWAESPLNNLENEIDMYFVHSFYVEPDDPSIISSTTFYSDINYASSIQLDNIFACQFHPEKSGEQGLKIYKNWAYINNLI